MTKKNSAPRGKFRLVENRLYEVREQSRLTAVQAHLLNGTDVRLSHKAY